MLVKMFMFRHSSLILIEIPLLSGIKTTCHKGLSQLRSVIDVKQLTNKEYEEYQKYKEDKLYGRLLTSDGLRLICAAENYDPEAIGKRTLEALAKIENKPY